MNKKDILNYVMNSPENTNYSVLNSMLESYSGENPNHAETITATLTNPFGTTEKYIEYRDEYAGNYSADAVLTADVSALGFATITNPIDKNTFEGCSVEYDNSLAFKIGFDINTGNITSGYVVQNGVITELTQYASLVPTTLTIYWHPMP